MKNNIVHKERYRNYTICVISDDDPQCPRANHDNLGTLATWHRRYRLGDEQPEISLSEYLWENLVTTNSPVTEDTPIDLLAIEAQKQAVILPVFMYDHSGLSLQTRPFSCKWDSGLLGIIYVRRDNADAQGMTEEQIVKCLQAEIATYNDYVSGNVYGYEIYGNDDESIDSCWGYYGNDFEQSDILPQARAVIDATIKRRLESHFAQVKIWIKHKVPLIKRHAMVL